MELWQKVQDYYQSVVENKDNVTLKVNDYGFGTFSVILQAEKENCPYKINIMFDDNGIVCYAIQKALSRAYTKADLEKVNELNGNIGAYEETICIKGSGKESFIFMHRAFHKPKKISTLKGIQNVVDDLQKSASTVFTEFN